MYNFNVSEYTMRENHTYLPAVITLDGASAILNEADGTKVTLDHGVRTAIESGVMDADLGAFFQRELEHIKAATYDEVLAELKARQLFPVSNEAGSGVNTITYKSFSKVGNAKVISGYAQDLPRSDISGEEITIPVRSIGASYGYNIDEIEAAATAKRPLDQMRANAARRAIEQTINSVAFFGDTDSGMAGFLSAKSVSGINVSASANNIINNAGSAVTGTVAQILAALHLVLTNVFNESNGVERPDTLLLPNILWSYIMHTPRSDTTDTTIASYLVNNSPFLNSLDDLIPVVECTNTPSHNNKDVIAAYTKNPSKLQLEIPVEAEFMAAQQRNLEFIIPGRARLAGMNIYYPGSARLLTVSAS